MTAQDPIELLLPEANEAQLELARRVTTLARLVVDDARPKLAQSERLDLASAREELERDQAEELARALDSLIAAYLTQEVSTGESFYWFEPGPLEFQEAWSVVLEARAEDKELPGVPAPMRAPLEIARQLCAALGSLRAGDSASAQSASWRAVIHALDEGPAEGESALCAVLEDLGGEPPRVPRIESKVVAHIAECLLGRGAVREALHWLRERRSLFCTSARLEQLYEWCTRLTSRSVGGELKVGAATKGEVRSGEALAPVPPRLQELFEGTGPEADRREQFAAAAIQVRDLRGPGHDRGTLTPRRGRAELGLSCLAVFRLEPDGVASAIRVEAAPGLQGRVETWLRERADACAVSSDPQQMLFVRAAEIVCHRRDEVRRAALGPEGALALALTPVLDPSGEVGGWVHMEGEHHLLPSGAVRSDLAEGWRDAVLQRRAAPAREDATSFPLDPRLDLGAEEEGALIESEIRPRSAQVYERILGELGLGLAHRRALGFDVRSSRLTCVHEAGLALSSPEAGGRRAIRRALQAGGAVLFEEPDARLSFHLRAGSGIVVPIRCGANLIGLLSLESSRRRDLSHREIERAFSIANDHGRSLACAQFADSHFESHGFAPHFEASRSDFGDFFERAQRAARSPSALTIAGPRGSGKRVLARLLTELTERSEPVEWTVESTDLGAGSSAFVERLVALCGEVLVLDGVEDLNSTDQTRLLRAIEQAGPSAPRLWTRLRQPLVQAVAERHVDPELALRLGRLELAIPPLSVRREEIPSLARSLLVHLAETAGREAPELDDHAAALLWRQPWRGNARELEAALARALHEAEGILLPEHFATGALLSQPLTRIPSRTPSRSDLVSALWTTRKLNGRGNRRRAALYLGWDPETLARRCTEAKVLIDTPEPPTPWLEPRT